MLMGQKVIKLPLQWVINILRPSGQTSQAFKHRTIKVKKNYYQIDQQDQVIMNHIKLSENT